MKDKKTAKPKKSKLYAFGIDETGQAAVQVFVLNSENCLVDRDGHIACRVQDKQVIWDDQAPRKLDVFIREDDSICWTLYTFNRHLAYSLLSIYQQGLRLGRKYQAEKVRESLRGSLWE